MPPLPPLAVESYGATRTLCVSASITLTATLWTGMPSYGSPSTGLAPWTTSCWIATERLPVATPSAVGSTVTVTVFGMYQSLVVKSSVVPPSWPFK